MYDLSLDVKTNLVATIPSPVGQHQYIAVTAYNLFGKESGFSNEIEYTRPEGENSLQFVFEGSNDLNSTNWVTLETCSYIVSTSIFTNLFIRGRLVINR